MSTSVQSIVKQVFHPLFQFAWSGVLLLIVVFPTDALAGNMLEKAIELVNESRSEAGLGPVIENEQLDRAAEAKADDMLKNDYFAHTSPLGQNPWYWVKQAGYEYKAAGENLAINYDNAKDQHKAWMKSETHRANILNSHFQEIGMATRHGRINGQEATVTVQLFGTPRTSVIAKKPTEPSKTTAEKAIEGVVIEPTPPVAIKATPVSMAAILNGTTVLINPTVFEKIMFSHFMADRVWLIWSELFMTLIFFSLAFALPMVFIGIMNMKLRASLHVREHAKLHIPIHMNLVTSSGISLHLTPSSKRRIV